MHREPVSGKKTGGISSRKVLNTAREGLRWGGGHNEGRELVPGVGGTRTADAC